MADIQPPEEAPSLHWSIRLVLASAIGFCAIGGLLFSFVLAITPEFRLGGAILGVMSLLVLSFAIRTFFNKHFIRRGQSSPLMLRLIAVYMATMPLFLIFSGQASSWSFRHWLLASSFLLGAPGVWRLAAWRAAGKVRL